MNRPLTIAFCLTAFIGLSGFPGCNLFTVKAEADPVKPWCAEACWEDCDPLPIWDGTRDQQDTIIKLDGILYKLCATRHQSCQACLARLRDTGVIL